jgi:hypothetical protein
MALPPAVPLTARPADAGAADGDAVGGSGGAAVPGSGSASESPWRWRTGRNGGGMPKQRGPATAGRGGRRGPSSPSLWEEEKRGGWGDDDGGPAWANGSLSLSLSLSQPCGCRVRLPRKKQSLLLDRWSKLLSFLANTSRRVQYELEWQIAWRKRRRIPMTTK